MEPLTNVVDIELPETLHLADRFLLSESARHVTNEMNIVLPILVKQDFFHLFEVVGTHQEPPHQLKNGSLELIDQLKYKEVDIAKLIDKDPTLIRTLLALLLLLLWVSLNQCFQ